MMSRSRFWSLVYSLSGMVLTSVRYAMLPMR